MEWPRNVENPTLQTTVVQFNRFDDTLFILLFHHAKDHFENCELKMHIYAEEIQRFKRIILNPHFTASKSQSRDFNF